MTKQYASMFVLLAFALTPALAGGKGKDEWQRLTEKRGHAEDRIEDLQQRLQGDDLSDRQRDRIEDRIQDIADKYGFEIPPPPEPEPEPDPEPTKLFSDDFARDQTEVGNGWLGHDGSIESEHMRITDGGEMYRTVPLDEPYRTVTISFDMVPDPNSSSGAVVGQDVSMFWTEGDPAVTRQAAVVTEMSEFPDHTSYTFTTPEKVDNAGEPEPYTSFGFGFTTGGGTAAIDNVIVVGEPFPASTFVGF